MPSSEYDRLLIRLADPETRYQALADLPRSSIRNAAAIAAPFLREGDPEVRYFAVECLLARGNQGYGERVVPLLRDPDATVRVSTLECLAKWKMHQVWRRVQRMLRDPSELVRGYAAWALQKIGAVEAVPGLRSRLGRERSTHTKVWILGALAVLDDDDACAQRVEKLLKHSDEHVRWIAANCLVGVARRSRQEQLRRFRRSLEEAVLAEADKGIRARLRQNLEWVREACD